MLRLQPKMSGDMELLPIRDEKIDALIAELSEHISRLETKRFQLLIQRGAPIERTSLEALIGNESPEAEDLLRTMTELTRVPALRNLVTQGRVSVYRAHQLSKATSSIPTEVVDRDESLLSERATSASRRELNNYLRRWRREQVSRGPSAPR
jgi:hypothetical protein